MINLKFENINKVLQVQLLSLLFIPIKFLFPHYAKRLIKIFCLLCGAGDRLTHAMDFTVILLLQINPTSPQFGQRLGVAGMSIFPL